MILTLFKTILHINLKKEIQKLNTQYTARNSKEASILELQDILPTAKHFLHHFDHLNLMHTSKTSTIIEFECYL